MSRRNGSGPQLDLKLNLSPPRVDRRLESPTRSATASPTSPPSSCVSSELNQEEKNYSNSPEATSMVLVGCPRCLMYVMLSEDDPKCPKCKSTVLLDFLHDTKNPTIRRSQSNRVRILRSQLCFLLFLALFFSVPNSRTYYYIILYQLVMLRN